ncbi:rhodanese-like domain-containing protein [Lactobacillus sp.]|uniref:rhodanese-like domain-containing protein n=1 Tax=Lactobacillus sp. TaxID=1591 RepID=UPI003F05B83F
MDQLQENDINKGVAEFRKTPYAKLIDVREKDEYEAGHIPASINIPLSSIGAAREEIADLDTPLFVHCRSGNRSAQAVDLLKQMGYSNVKNIGGIVDYRGETE